MLAIDRGVRLTHVVEGAHDDTKLLDPLDVILGLFDVAMARVDLDTRGGVEVARSGRCDDGLGLGDVGLAEEELAVEVGEVDGVEVDLM